MRDQNVLKNTPKSLTSFIYHVLQGELKARTIELDEGHKSYQMKTNDKQTNSNRHTSCMLKVETTEECTDLLIRTDSVISFKKRNVEQRPKNTNTDQTLYETQF